MENHKTSPKYSSEVRERAVRMVFNHAGDYPTQWAAISSRSANDRYRPESGFAEELNIVGGMPPAFRNHLVPTGCDTPAWSAASSLLSPLAIAHQNLVCSSRPATGGRPGDGNGARPDRIDRRLRIPIATSYFRALRRPLESAQYVSIKYTERLAEAGLVPSVGSVGDSYDNALAETINGLYKSEVIWRRGPWRSMEAVEFATLEWVDWFNNRRLLSSIGHVPPAEAEAAYYASLEELKIAA
jgi:putative transposase